MRKPLSLLGSMAAVVTLAVACSGAGGAGYGSGGGGGGGGGDDSGDAGKVTITAPKDGATVEQPFTLKFDAGDIGPTDSGKDHVHVFVDGKEGDYTVVTKNSFVIKGLSAGKHTINVTKQHADHSPTGAKAEIDVTVSGGGSSDETSSTGGGYDY